MSFLAPLFLLGAAAIALPILFHLIRRTSRERTLFSSLMFLQPSPPRVTRRSRLENIFLLILRCLVFCLLALGFARPFMNKPLAAPTAGGPGKMVVVLLDDSASMRREGLWDRAKERARDVLRKLDPADQAALVLFNDQPRTLISLGEWNAAQPNERAELAISRVATANPSWAGTHLGNALLAGLEIVQNETEMSRRIVLISDLQSGAHLDGLQGHEWPKGIEVVIEPIKSTGRSNAGLHLVNQRDEVALSSNQVPWRIRIANAADSRKEQFKVSWRGASTPAVEAYIPPGQSRVLQPPKPPDAASGEMILTGDDDTFDNTLYWVRSEPARVNIAYLGSETETDTAKPLFFLKRALQQTAAQQLSITNRVVPDAPLIIVSDRLEGPALETVRAQLAAGKTVLVTMNSPALADTVAQLAGSGQLAASEATIGNYALLGEIDFTHPIFKPFADPRFSDFTKIHFWKYRRIDEIPGARVLARFDSGDPALLQKGSLLVLTTGWSPADSQLALASKFVPLLYSLLEFSGSPQGEPAQYLLGETAHNAPGIYTVTNTTKQLAVNLTPSESKTSPLTFEDFEQLGIPLQRSQPDRSKEMVRRAQQLQAAEMENQQKLWRWLIVVALGVVLLETWLAGRLTTAPAGAAATHSET